MAKANPLMSYQWVCGKEVLPSRGAEIKHDWAKPVVDILLRGGWLELILKNLK